MRREDNSVTKENMNNKWHRKGLEGVIPGLEIDKNLVVTEEQRCITSSLKGR